MMVFKLYQNTEKRLCIVSPFFDPLCIVRYRPFLVTMQNKNAIALLDSIGGRIGRVPKIRVLRVQLAHNMCIYIRMQRLYIYIYAFALLSFYLLF